MSGTHVILFGATSPTGRTIVDGALARGHSVSAIVRNPAALSSRPAIPGQWEVLKGDLTRPETVAAAFAQIAAKVPADKKFCVVYSAGVSGLKESWKQPRPVVFYKNSGEGILAAIEQSGAKARFKRIVAVTSRGVRHERDEKLMYTYVVKPLILQPVYDDMLVMEKLFFEKSGLEVIIVRPGMLVDQEDTAKYRMAVADNHCPEKSNMATLRSDLAEFVVEQIDGSKWVNKRPTLSNVRRDGKPVNYLICCR